MELHFEPILRRTAPGTPPPGSGGQRVSSRSYGSPDQRPEALRLMIVEDDAFVALDAKEILETAGYEVVALAKSANEAVDKAGELRPDVILMDIRLLGPRDGVDAAIEIYDRFGVRSLFASAHSDAETRDRADAARPLGFLSKPVTRKALLDAVERSAGQL
jgi:DNA-binding NarL/FixJ family response regulator